MPVDIVALGQVGSLALACGFLALFMSGWIIPKGSHEDVKRQRDKLVETNEKLAEAVRALSAQRRD